MANQVQVQSPNGVTNGQSSQATRQPANRSEPDALSQRLFDDECERRDELPRARCGSADDTNNNHLRAALRESFASAVADALLMVARLLRSSDGLLRVDFCVLRCHGRVLRSAPGSPAQPPAASCAAPPALLCSPGRLLRDPSWSAPWLSDTLEKSRSFVGQHFWARGYFVSTVGRDEVAIREYIRNQEAEDRWLDQLRLW